MIPLVKDPDCLVRLEQHLMELSVDAFSRAGVDSNIFGVFSLDELERKAATELSRKVAVGVQYFRSAPLEIDFNPKGSASATGGGGARMVGHEFLVILAVPVDPVTNTDSERYNVAKLLTILRRGIHGVPAAGDRTARPWGFLREAPNVSESTETMLYYSQVWLVALPLVGPQ